MPIEPKKDEIEEQANRILHAEKEAGLKPVEANEETISYRATVKGYRIGTDFAFTVLASIILGWLIDHFFETGPWGLLALLLTGFSVGIMNLWRAVGQTNSENEKTSKASGE